MLSLLCIIFATIVIIVIVTQEQKRIKALKIVKEKQEIEKNIQEIERLKLKRLEDIEKQLKESEDIVRIPIVLKYSKNVHFITYGDKVFENAKKKIMDEASSSGFFNTIKSYSPSDLSLPFAHEFKDVLTLKRGGGYWIWKFDIIMQRLSEIPKNDILVYTDAGCSINKSGYSLYEKYVQNLQQEGNFIISFQMPHIEEQWSIKEIFHLFEIPQDSEIRKTGQYIGGILIMKNCQETIDLFERCLLVLRQDNQIITDYYNDKSQPSFFRDNRHDQSVLSIVRKMTDTVVYDDNTFFSDFNSPEAKLNPFLAMRRM